MKQLLLVDDNAKYSRLLREYFQPLGYSIDEAVTAAEGLNTFLSHSEDHYSVIVTDITMESQLAGLFMLYKIRKKGFHGTVVVASTGFDFLGVVNISRLILRICGVHFLVRKTTVIKKEPEFWPMSLFSPPQKKFQEI